MQYSNANKLSSQAYPVGNYLQLPTEQNNKDKPFDPFGSKARQGGPARKKDEDSFIR